MEFNIIKTEGTGGTPEQLYTRNIASSKVIGKVILFDDKSFPLGAVVMPNEVVGGGLYNKINRLFASDETQTLTDVEGIKILLSIISRIQKADANKWMKLLGAVNKIEEEEIDSRREA